MAPVDIIIDLIQRKKEEIQDSHADRTWTRGAVEALDSVVTELENIKKLFQ